MTTRTMEQIDAEIETVRATAGAIPASLNQEKILVEALDACNSDEERQAVENVGPSFIDQYFTALEKFTGCSCTRGSGFPSDLLYVMLPSIGILIKKHTATEGDKITKYLVGKIISSGHCYYRHELVRVYCLVKSDPSILERTREQLGRQELVS